jgi:hypothetical protein
VFTVVLRCFFVVVCFKSLSTSNYKLQSYSILSTFATADYSKFIFTNCGFLAGCFLHIGIFGEPGAFFPQFFVQAKMREKGSCCGAK